MNVYFRDGHERTFGTWPLKGQELVAAMRLAAEVGYRSFDTAQMYGNEAEVGATLKDLRLPRSAVCITTKVHPDNLTAARFLPSVHESLRQLQLDYVDVLLLHWPPLGGDLVPALQQLEQAARAGLARNIGLSNCTAAMMRTARATVGLPLVANQVEFHPLLDQRRLLEAAVETGIPLSSYCSLARGAVFKHPEFGAIGMEYGKSAAQVVLRWILQKGLPVNTMSTRRANLRANFDVMNFTLSSIDMARIDALSRFNVRIVDRHVVPWAPAWD